MPLRYIWEPFERGRDSFIEMKFDVMAFLIIIGLWKWILIEAVAFIIDILGKMRSGGTTLNFLRLGIISVLGLYGTINSLYNVEVVTITIVVVIAIFHPLVY